MKFDLITRNKNQTEKEKHKIRREQSALREQSAIPQGQMRSVETVIMMMMMMECDELEEDTEKKEDKGKKTQFSFRKASSNRKKRKGKMQKEEIVNRLWAAQMVLK